MLKTEKLPFAFFTFAFGRLAIKAAFLEFHQETVFLALFLKRAHGFFKTVFV